MNHEHQYGFPKKRPLSNIGTQSPKFGGNVTSLPKLAGYHAAKVSPPGRGEARKENDAAEDGYREEDVATPVKAFLSSNVTPRSGSRKARAETGSPTTNGTPNASPTMSRPMSSYERHERPGEDARATSGFGLRLSDAGRRSRTSSMVSDGPGSSVSSRPVLNERNNSFTRIAASPDSAPKFFHADDVRPTLPPRSVPETSQSQTRLPGHTPATDENHVGNITASMSNTPARDEQKGKMFFAKDFRETKSPPPRLVNGNSTSRPPLHTIYSAQTANSPPRATSPLKEEILTRKPSVSKASPRRHTRLVSNGGSELKSPEVTSSGNGDLSRRSSLNAIRTPKYGSHARSSSVHSKGPISSRRSSIALSDTSPVERIRTTSLVGASGELPHSVNPPSTTQELPNHQLFTQPESPTRPTAGGQSKIDQMNELAAKARRERKVLDLEISNSSLLAINRTLEREMRKQNNELRRYRRLSRSGRISIVPSSRSASGKMSILSETSTSIDSDDVVSATDEEDDLNDLHSPLSSTSAVSQPSSPTARAAQARFQDPTRIALDLTAHRALLLDSQKLNQSIKRCLSNSEAMILAGKRALEYQVTSPEPPNLGPRVLTPEEFDGDTFVRGQGLLSPGTDQEIINPWDQKFERTESIGSGLETPDYSKWGPPTAAQTPFAETVELTNQPSDDDAKLGVLDDARQGFRTEVNPDFPPFLEDETRRPSMIASIDGLDDDPDTESESQAYEERPVLTTRGSHPDSYAARAERKSGIKSPEIKPGQPGYRGSMQGLGHYLQAFSIFGTSQQT